ncbi:uncharacterized protein FYW23_015858 isoform 6-T6 [Sylvia borin]
MSAGRGVVTSRPRRVGRCGGSGSGAGNSPGNSGSGSGTGSAGSAANGGNSGSAAMEYVSPEQLAGFSKYKSEDDVPVDVPEPVGAEEMNSAVGHQQNQPL